MQKTALILGITGAFGAAVAEALMADGWALKALLRDPARLPQRFKGVTVVQGEVQDLEALRRAGEGVELVVYGVNPPGYDWENKALPWLENTLRMVQERRLTLVFPGNVYVLDPMQGPNFDEQAQLVGQTSKGKIRLAMESQLQAASQQGARVINIRLGDFFSAEAQSSWLQALLKKSRKGGYSLALPGPADLEHSWAYLPDVADTLVEVLKQRQALPAYALFHFQGYRVSLRQIAEALSQATGQPVHLRAFPWWLLGLLRPFVTLFRGLWEMRYLWQQAINLDEHKLLALLGPARPQTPLQVALLATLPERPKQRLTQVKAVTKDRQNAVL